MNNAGKYVVVPLMVVLCAAAQVTYRPVPNVAGLWSTDSLFVGASMVVLDSTAPVEVSYVASRLTVGVGELHFVQPAHQDSTTFVFHNQHERFPDEPATVSLGSFAVGTELHFMCRNYQIIGTFLS